MQVYDNEHVFLDTLAGFVGGGINQGDTIVLVATPAHVAGLQERLTSFGIHVESLIAAGQYLCYDAQETLQKFMVNGMPDEGLFKKTVIPVMEKAGKNRKVRAFGEMVALTMAEGNLAGTIALEQLWTEYMKTTSFSLFCAYPKNTFAHDPVNAVTEICNCHSKLISGSISSMEHIYYRAVSPN